MLFTLLRLRVCSNRLGGPYIEDKGEGAFAECSAMSKRIPADKMRLEVHTDAAPLKQQKMKSGKIKGFKDNQALSAARARALAVLMEEAGSGQRILRPSAWARNCRKRRTTTPEGRELNNRVEIVVYPADVKVINSQKLPVLKDRERVVVSLGIQPGPPGQEAAGRGAAPERNAVRQGQRLSEGQARSNRGSPAQNWSGSSATWSRISRRMLYYLCSKKGIPRRVLAGRHQGPLPDLRAAGTVPMFDPGKPSLRGNDHHRNVPEVPSGHCLPKSSSMVPWMPVIAICATIPMRARTTPGSESRSGTLCTTCHPDQGNGVHVVAGYIRVSTHPTQGKRDRSRPGKSISCTSCHDPHRGEHVYFFAYEVKNRVDLCKACHKK